LNPNGLPACDFAFLEEGLLVYLSLLALIVYLFRINGICKVRNSCLKKEGRRLRVALRRIALPYQPLSLQPFEISKHTAVLVLQVTILFVIDSTDSGNRRKPG
jgi:hypothetical protein